MNRLNYILTSTDIKIWNNSSNSLVFPSDKVGRCMNDFLFAIAESRNFWGYNRERLTFKEEEDIRGITDTIKILKDFFEEFSPSLQRVISRTDDFDTGFASDDTDYDSDENDLESDMDERRLWKKDVVTTNNWFTSHNLDLFINPKKFAFLSPVVIIDKMNEIIDFLESNKFKNKFVVWSLDRPVTLYDPNDFII